MNEMNNQIPVPPADPAIPEATTTVLPVNPLTKAAKSPLFLTIAILLSISFGFNFLSSLSYGFGVDVITLLLLIGTWIVYANAKHKADTDTLGISGPNLISGTVKAMRIITLVGSIVFMVAGVLCGILAPVLKHFPDFNETVVGEFQAMQLTFGNNVFRYADEPDMALSILIGMAVGFIVAGILLLILYYCFFLRFLHNFTYSACENIKSGTAIDCKPALRKWMMTLGIIEAVFSFISPDTLITNGTMAAIMIITAVWLKKSFENQ